MSVKLAAGFTQRAVERLCMVDTGCGIRLPLEILYTRQVNICQLRETRSPGHDWHWFRAATRGRGRGCGSGSPLYMPCSGVTTLTPVCTAWLVRVCPLHLTTHTLKPSLPRPLSTVTKTRIPVTQPESSV